MKKTDRELGMHKKISRRDFIHDLSIASIGMSLPGITFAEKQPLAENSARYRH